MMGTWLNASPSSPLTLAKGMKPPNADTEMRTEFGPAAAWITACVPGSQASGLRFLSTGTVCTERREESTIQEEHPQDNHLVHVKSREGYTIPSCYGGVPPSTTIMATCPCKGLLQSYLSQHWRGGISELPTSWTLHAPCLGKGMMCGHGAGSLCSAPIREEAFPRPGKPLVKDNQACCHRANSDSIKAVMKFTAGLASPSNGPAPQ